jgi:hypothetical protein
MAWQAARSDFCTYRGVHVRAGISLTGKRASGEKTLSRMKLEELRQRLRESRPQQPVTRPGRRRKKGRPRHKRSRGPDFGISVAVTAGGGVRVAAAKLRKLRCSSCKKRFRPDPRLGYIPSLCPGCDDEDDSNEPCPNPTCKHTLAEHGPRGCTKCACKGFELTLDEKCVKCGKRFMPDPNLKYVPNVCASCESYL